jgi:hypothetical protein
MLHDNLLTQSDIGQARSLTSLGPLFVERRANDISIPRGASRRSCERQDSA